MPTADELLADMFERPLTDDERRQLKQVGQAPRIGASVIGFVALVTGLVGVMGPVADPSFFSMFTLTVAVLAIVTSAAARTRRRGAALALARGSVLDAYGVPVHQADGPLGSLDLGTTRFALRRPGAPSVLPTAQILEGRLNRFSYVNERPMAGGAVRGWILAVNGALLRRPTPCQLSPSPTGAPEGAT